MSAVASDGVPPDAASPAHPARPLAAAAGGSGPVARPTIWSLVDVDRDDPRLLADVLPVLAELRPHLTAGGFTAICAEAWPQGLRYLAAYDGAGRCVGVAGWRLVATTQVVRKLYVDDLVTATATRSAGVGRALLGELGRRAAAAGCTVLDLDSGVQRFDAHRFYLRERMAIVSHHFSRPV